jgi:hypothetical protein
MALKMSVAAGCFNAANVNETNKQRRIVDSIIRVAFRPFGVIPAVR